MKISTKGRYAIRMLIDLSEHMNEGFIPLKDVSERQNISKKYLEQIVPLLNNGKLLRTERGAQGGYQIAKAPDTVTVADVLRLTEGSLAPVDCGGQNPVQCVRGSFCAALPVWQGLTQVIIEYLESITLQDILDQQRERDSSYDYVI